MKIPTAKEASEFLNVMVVHELINTETNIQDFAVLVMKLRSRVEKTEAERDKLKEKCKQLETELDNMTVQRDQYRDRG